jgi:hypothetical protein
VILKTFNVREKSLIMKQCYWYSNDGTLVLEMENSGNNGNVFSMLHSGRQLHNKYTTAP